MKKILLAAAFLFSACVVYAAEAGIQWTDNLSKGLALAKSTGKPVMADFYADWCGWCRKLDKTSYADPAVIKLSKDFVCVKVDTDKDGASASKYGVTGLPTILFLSPKGEVTETIVGYRDAAFFRGLMQKLSKPKK